MRYVRLVKRTQEDAQMKQTCRDRAHPAGLEEGLGQVWERGVEPDHANRMEGRA